MKILVTGANGFLGKTIIENLLRVDYFDVYGVSRKKTDISSKKYKHILLDLNDYNSVKKTIEEIDPVYIFHFAANPIVKDKSNSLINDNVSITNNILSCFNKNFVFASSATVYGSDDKFFTVDSELKPESLYAVTKLQSEELVKFYARTKQIKSGLCIRYVAHVGKNSTHGVLFDIKNKILKNKKEIELFGDYPGSIKPFLLAEQSMSLTLQEAFSNNYEYKCINMSPSDSISISQLVDRVCIYLNIDRIKKKWLGQNSTWMGDQKKLSVYSEYSSVLFSSVEAVDLAIGDIFEKNTNNRF